MEFTQVYLIDNEYLKTQEGSITATWQFAAL